MKQSSFVARAPTRPSCALLIGSILSTCSGDTEHAVSPSVERWDSAGVRIVESRRPAWEDSSQWSIDPVPLLDFVESAADTAHNFYQVRGMLRLSDGSFAIANRGSHEVRFYSPEGRYRGATGRRGEGPGDFTRILGISLTTSDTLVVLDNSERMTVLGPNGSFVRVVRIPDSRLMHALGNDQVVVMLRPTADYMGGPGLVRQPTALWRYDLAGVQLDSIGETDGNEDYSFLTESGRSGWGLPLFAKAAVVTTWGNRIYRGNANAMQVEELSSSGQLLRILRLPDYPLDLTPGTIEAERRVRLGDNPHPLIREIVDQLPDPERRPAYRQIVVDATGAIWLRPFLDRSELGRAEAWLVLDSDGTWLGYVDVLAGLGIMRLEGDVLMGVWTDSLGVEHPRVYRLRRGP